MFCKSSKSALPPNQLKVLFACGIPVSLFSTQSFIQNLQLVQHGGHVEAGRIIDGATSAFMFALQKDSLKQKPQQELTSLKMESVISELQSAITEEFPSISVPEEPAVVHKPGKKLELGKNICYIVGAVVIEEGKILMMREAKASCRGLWYLPAGRLKENETFVDGAKRETEEETGLRLEPTAVTAVDCMYDHWYRITFTGHITGGKLKTLDEKDKESLEAGWFTRDEIFFGLALRARDICSLIDVALKWHVSSSSDAFFSSLPVAIPHHDISVQIVLVYRADDGIKVLINAGSKTIPTQVIQYKMQITEHVHQLLRVADGNAEYAIHGIIGIEHVGNPHGSADGMRLTLIVEAQKVQSLSSKFQWLHITNESLISKITKLIDTGGCIKITEH